MSTKTAIVEREALALEPGLYPGMEPRWTVRVPELDCRFFVVFEDNRKPGRAGTYLVKYHPDDQFAYVSTR